MVGLAYWIRRGFDTLLVPFDWLPPTLSLLAIAAVTAVLMVIVVGKVTPQARIKRARADVAAAIYEIRLFLDSPRRVFAAQGKLLGGALAYTLWLMPAFIVLTPPLGLLYVALEARHGLEPLPVDRPVVIAVAIDEKLDGYDVAPVDVPAGVAVTAPPLYDAERHEVYLRIEVRQPGTYELPIRADGAVVTKRISTEAGATLTPARHRGAALLWGIGLEDPIRPDAPVREVRVPYRAADPTWLGLSMPWWLFWLIASTVGALAVHKRLGVEL